jgi:hypothetical protein
MAKLTKDKEGYYIIDSLEKLQEWQKMTNLTPAEKKKLRKELETNPLKKDKKDKKKFW